jgi:hypothetical protein
MTRARLADIEPTMNTECRDVLGHAIYYTPVGGARRTVYVQANYEDGEAKGGFSAAVEQKIEIMVIKTDVTAMPGRGVRITLPRVPGKLFEPVDVQNDESGYHWLFSLKAVAV